jgi:lysophospholipid acyltransferase (LPLAT)-like uncharacterized protein
MDVRTSLRLAIVPRVGYAYVRLVHATMRIEWRDRDALERARRTAGRYILAFWHSRFVMMPYAYPGSRMVVMSSRHPDSLLLARVLERFGIEHAWGSSTAGGSQGMRQLLRHVRDGCDAGFTPDGPRGPRRRVKPGVVAAAKLSGLPIVPVTFAARPAKRLGSWDRTLLPLPFARGLFAYGEPIAVDRRADDAALDRAARRLEAELDRLTDDADRAIGFPVEEPREP